jgi:hypothetical protein
VTHFDFRQGLKSNISFFNNVGKGLREDEMKSLHLPLWLAFLVLVSHATASAQSSVEPITAKQRELSYQIQPDGSRVLKNEQAGVFYRSSSGASIRTVGDRSTLIDAQGDRYEINHNKKLARLTAHGVLPYESIKSMNNARPSNIQEEVVNGLACAVVPAYYNADPTDDPNAKPSGKAYFYPPYGLWVKSEFTNPEGSLLTVRELYDIEIIEPDPALVRIPEGYSIDPKPEQ